MTIVLNGEPREIPARASLADLLPEPGAPGLAVAVNGEVLPRARVATHPLADGDVVEVVTAVQGG